jgi:predicted nucleotidyltransferase
MGNPALNANICHQITRSIELVKKALMDDLLGVYLYGSSIVGGLLRYSDIDLFVVSTRPTTQEERNTLAKDLLRISGVYRGTKARPIEMTIVVKSEVNPWHYPPSFDFQYGEWLRSEFESGNIEPWPTRIRADLALLITQVLLASRTVYGSKPGQLLAHVPYKDFMNAMTDELDCLPNDLDTDTRNVLLTLARIWRTVGTDSISSKQKAAEWAIERLPDHFRPVVQRALKTASGDQEETWDDLKNNISECADFIEDQIRVQIKNIQACDNTSKSIMLAD